MPITRTQLSVPARIAGAYRNLRASIQQMGFDAVMQHTVPIQGSSRPNITAVNPQVLLSQALPGNGGGAAVQGGPPAIAATPLTLAAPRPTQSKSLKYTAIGAGLLVQAGFSAVSIPMMAALVLPVSAPAWLAWMAGGLLSLAPTAITLLGYFGAKKLFFSPKKPAETTVAPRESAAPPKPEAAPAPSPDGVPTAAAGRPYEESLTGLKNAISDLRKEISEKAPAERVAELQRQVERLARTLGLFIEAEERDGTTIKYVIFPETEAAGSRYRSPRIPSGKLIGQGGMADVYGAIELRSGTAVAIKYLAEPEHRERFENEAKRMMEVQNEGVVRVLSRRNGNYFVMEYMSPQQWPTLLQYLRQKEGKLAPAEAVRIAIRICEVMGSLGQLHHRDIKLENIFINAETGAVKIADFGLAKFPGEGGPESSTGIVGGTHPNMAPYYATEYARVPTAERQRQVRKMNEILTKNDLFGAGAALYKLLTGHVPTWQGDRRPFHVANNPSSPSEIGLIAVVTDYTNFTSAKSRSDAVKMAEIKRRFTLVAGFTAEGVTIPGAVYEVLSRMLAFDPDENFASFLEAKQALERALASLGQAEEEEEEEGRPVTDSMIMDATDSPAAQLRSFIKTGNTQGIQAFCQQILLGEMEIELGEALTLAEMLCPLRGRPDINQEILNAAISALEERVGVSLGPIEPPPSPTPGPGQVGPGERVVTDPALARSLDALVGMPKVPAPEGSEEGLLGPSALTEVGPVEQLEDLIRTSNRQGIFDLCTSIVMGNIDLQNDEEAIRLAGMLGELAMRGKKSKDHDLQGHAETAQASLLAPEEEE